ncbi:autotransporter-associated beta strand repeat-containing protein, partial [Thiomicrorhabdus sp.]|uniref:autotransporter-associated beta strand repeat-containing protein n=1 Tax=Thiomicrorhabdus sp. TaxID=2039724 RepID=UPI0035659CB5
MLGIVRTHKEADSRIFRTKLKPLVVAMLPLLAFGNMNYANAGSCAAGAVTIASGSGGCTVDGVNPVTTVEFLPGVTNSDPLKLTGGNAPSGAVTTQADGRGMVSVEASTTSQNSFGIAGTGDLNLVTLRNGSTFNLGHDLAANFLNINGTLNQTAGTVTLNSDMDLTLPNAVYNQSGTGVLHGTRIILGSTGTLILQNQGSGVIQGSTPNHGALIFAGNYDTDSVLGINTGGSSGSLASITVNDGVTLTLDKNASATTVNVGQGASGILNQSAATLRATNLNVNNGATYNLSGTGVVNATNISIGSGASLNVNQAGNTSIASTVSGSGAITQNGSGTLTLSGSNTYSGGTTINDGTLSISSDSNLGDPSGDIVFNGGTLQATSDLTLNSGRSITLNSGGGTIDTGANNVIYNGRFELADGGLIKKGSGTLTHTEYANYSGNTVIEDGTLKISNFSKGSYINNGALIVDVHSGNRNMIHGIGGTGSFTKEGAGSVGLWGDKTYTGNTYINNGILYAHGNYALGSNGAVTVNSTGTLVLAGNLTVGSLAGAGNVDLSYSGANTLTTGGNNTSTTFSGVLSGGGGSLVKTGTGTLTLIGLNTYSGGTTVNGGSLQGTTDSLQGDVVNNANVAFDQSASGTYAGAMSGTGHLIKSNTGVLTLTGTNTYSGGTTVSGGTLQGTTDSLQGDIVNNANVVFDQSASGTYAGAMGGTGHLIKSNTGVVTLTGTN